MARTALCADGLHSICTGNCAKWVASRDEKVLGRTGEDGCAVIVECGCECHVEGECQAALTAADIEVHRGVA